MVQASRKALRSQRRGLTQTEQQRAAEAVAQSAKHLIASLNLRTLGAYWPNDGELSGLPILQEALVLGLTCTLPIISNQSLTFARIGPTTRFHPNRYEILEPIQDADSEVPLLLHGPAASCATRHMRRSHTPHPRRPSTRIVFETLMLACISYDAYECHSLETCLLHLFSDGPIHKLMC